MRLKAGSRAEGFKSHGRRSKKIWKNLLTNKSTCAIMSMPRGGSRKTGSAVKFAQGLKSEKIFEKLFKNLLTNPTKCGIIRVSRGERQLGCAETNGANGRTETVRTALEKSCKFS